MTALPEEAVKAAIAAYDKYYGDLAIYPSEEPTPEGAFHAALKGALPFLPVQGAVKKLEWDEDGCAKTPFGMYTVAENAEDTWSFTFYDYPYGIPEGEFGTLDEAKAAAQADYEARILSALEPSAPDMGNPITDKTVKMVLAEAIAQVWYQTRDCDVEEIDRIIAHLNRNGLLIVGSQRFKMMADAIQSASAYLALSQPNSAETLIADLDAALNGETVRANQLSGISGQLIESLINDADWLGEYGHQMHEESEYHDGGYIANRLQAIGDRISKLLETGIPATQPSAARELALEEGDLNARLKAKGMYSIDEMMGNLPIDKWRVHSGMTDLTFFGEWLERKSREYLTMKAAYDVGDKDESDELYEWVLAHYGAFHDVLVNFRAALSSPDHADAGKVEGDGIERGKFYHHQWPMERLLDARIDGLVDHSGGEAWRYEYSHKDEHGKYDILYRPVKNLVIPARLPSAPSEGAE